MDTRLSSLKAIYRELYQVMEVDYGKTNQLGHICDRIKKNKILYDEIEEITNVPWWFVGAIHYMECGLRCDRHFYNGNALTSRTTDEPKDRPAFEPADGKCYTFVESAVSALEEKGFDDVKDESLEAWLWRAHLYNGFGAVPYLGRDGKKSYLYTPYLWAGTSVYKQGKFVSDGKYDPEAISQQLGAAPIIRELVGSAAIAPLDEDKEIGVSELKEIQLKLTKWGLLDPGVKVDASSNKSEAYPDTDGKWGSQSRSALLKFCQAFNYKEEDDGELDRRTYEFVRSKGDPAPLKAEGSDFWAYRIAKWYEKYSDRFWIARGTDVCNHTGVEGMNYDFTPNADTPDLYNDLIVLWSVNLDGTCRIVDKFVGSSEPGKYYTIHPMNKNGAARISLGCDGNGTWYRSWYVGMHGSSARHEALVQGWRESEKVLVHRDRNKDFKRSGDLVQAGNFAINLHAAGGNKYSIGRWSAGCQVVHGFQNQARRMAVLKQDRRYQANRGYRFSYGVIPGDRLYAARREK